MTLEDAANTSRSEGNMELAQQWIDDLKKSNAKLSKVWPILLVLSVLFCALFLYSQYQFTAMSNQTLAEIEALEKERDALKNQSEALVEQAKVLEGELATLKESHNAQSDSVNTELTEKDRMIESLQLKVAELETNTLEMTKALVLAKKELIETTQGKDSELSELNNKYRSFSSDMNKQLNDRKTAYTALAKRHKETKAEMERLAGLLDNKSTELNKTKRDRDSLRKNLISTQKQLSAVKQDKQLLEDKLASLMAPISKQSQNEKQASSKTNKDTGIDKGLAFQPITATSPINKNVETKETNESVKDAAAYDFDTIAID